METEHGNDLHVDDYGDDDDIVVFVFLICYFLSMVTTTVTIMVNSLFALFDTYSLLYFSLTGIHDMFFYISRYIYTTH